MKKLILTSIALLLCWTSRAQSHEWNWAVQAGSSSWDHGYSITLDKESDVIVRGKLAGTSYFGNQQINITGDEQDYLAKYDSSGNLKWVHTLGGMASWLRDKGIATDQDNNIYVAGYFDESLEEGSYHLTSNGGYDAYVAKYNATGKLIWIKGFGGSLTDVAYSIVCDRENKIYFTGYFYDTAWFGSQYLVSRGGTDMYMAKLDSSGSVIWAKRGGGTQDDFSNSLAIDAYNHVYAIGEFSGTADFGNENITSSSGTDIFVVRYQADGTEGPVLHDGGVGDVEGKSISTGPKGEIYITGKFSGTATFGQNQQVQANGQNDFYVVKYDQDFNFEWVRTGSSSASNESNSILAKNDKIYVTGRYGGTLNLVDTSITASSRYDLFIVAYNTSGAVVWAEQAEITGGTFDMGKGNSICVNDSQDVFVGGEYAGTGSFGGHPMTSSGSFDMYLLKINDHYKASSSNVSPSEIDTRIELYASSGTIHIRNPEQKEVLVSIYNINGKLIRTQKILETYSKIELNDTGKDVLMARIQTQNSCIIRKIILR